MNSVILARNGLEVHGVDIQQEAIEQSIRRREKEPKPVRRRLSFQCAPFAQMALPSGAFDSVIAFSVFGHFCPDELLDLLEKLADAFRPSGYLLEQMPRFDSFSDPAHVMEWDPASVRERLAEHFEILRSFVTEENDVVPGSQRVNVVARLGPDTGAEAPTSGLPALHSRIETFGSRHFSALYTQERAKNRLKALADASLSGTAFSWIRLGDMEIRLLAFGRIAAGLSDQVAEGDLLMRHLGVNPAMLSESELRALQEELIDGCAAADILGTHRGTINRDWARLADAVLAHYGITSQYLPNEVDVCFCAEILDQGILLPLLSRGRILLVGNAAPRFAELLANASYRARFSDFGMPEREPEVIDALHVPHDGTAAYDALAEIWSKVEDLDFDTAFVAASLVGKVLVTRMKARLGVLALDIGWNMQFLAGVSSPVAPAGDMTYAQKRRGYSRLFEGRTGLLEGT